jgi:hypoxia up-regulated 1
MRYKEAETLIPAIADLEQAHTAGHIFLESARQNFSIEMAVGAPNKYTLEELENVETRLNESTTWLKETSEKQKQLARNDDPVLLTAEVKARGVTLQNQVLKLLRRKAPKPKKTTTTDATTDTSTATKEETDTTSTTSTRADRAEETTRERDEL